MEGLMEALVSLFESIVGFAGQTVGILGSLLRLPAIIPFIIMIIVFVVAFKNTGTLWGTILFLFGGGLTIFIIVSFFFWPFLFKGSENNLNSCYKSAGNNPVAIEICDGIGSGFKFESNKSSSSSNGSSTSTIVIIEDPDSEEEPEEVVRTFKKDALKTLTANWNLKPSDWPSELPGQLVGPNDVPYPVKVFFSCENRGATKINEKWQMRLVWENSGVDSVTLEVNGFFAREDKGGFNADPNGSMTIGTGTWDEICPSCYTDKVVSTPTTSPTQPAATPAIGTKSPFPQTICGYWGYFFTNQGWQVVPTTDGKPDFGKPSSLAYATQDIKKRCPAQALPPTP
jgi:hypothetical protein